MRQLTAFDFHHTLDQVEGVALVIFTATACGACRRLRSVLEGAPALFSDLHLFEVDAGHEPGLAAEFEVFHLPSLYLFVDGHYHAQLHAEPVATQLRQAADRLLAAPAQEAP